jgi:Skp family chaperone for outer membrane proteins
MNGRTTMICVALFAAALLAAFERSHAQSDANVPASKIGILSIQNVFNGSSKHAQYRRQAMEAQNQARAELEKLAQTVKVEEGDLRTLAPGTADHTAQLQVVIEAQTKLKSQEEFLKQQRAFEEKQWFDKLYRETLRIVGEVAQEKGLELVLERTEPQFPIPGEQFLATVSMHKVLYGGGCVDLTAEVTARLDASEDVKP